MTEPDLSGHPHRRRNILTGDWVLVSPHRTQRPWQGQKEEQPASARPAYDAKCYLCPGNERAAGAVNPDYSGTFAFDNDFPALLPDTPAAAGAGESLLVARMEPGVCRVVCFSPRHDLTLAEMSVPDIAKVVSLWASEYAELGGQDAINYVQIFENKGAAMGCSNPHPHGQLWAQQTLPNEPARELQNMRRHFDETGKPLLVEYLNLELRLEERVVCGNPGFVAVVPFWAVWPFEILILPRRQVASLPELTSDEREWFADIIRQVTIRYDNLFQVSFPYSSGIHQAPTDGDAHPACTLHMHFYPPLLRSATVRKFMVGYEMLAGPQRDITPEAAAGRLREQPEVHYAAATGVE